MKDFNFYAPTQVAFGKSSEERLPELIRQYGGTKVLVHYGGQSARKSGLLQKVFDLLNAAHLPYIEMGGVVPNPLLSMVYQGSVGFLGGEGPTGLLFACRYYPDHSCRRQRDE